MHIIQNKLINEINNIENKLEKIDNKNTVIKNIINYLNNIKKELISNLNYIDKNQINYSSDEINFIEPKHKPDSESLFETTLPKSKTTVKCKILSVKEENEIEELNKNYPSGMVAPTITKKLEKHIVELNGSIDRQKISQFINSMPIIDSKHIRNFIYDCTPQLDLLKTVTAPSGEKVNVIVGFGAEFFRPFFSL